MLLLAIMYSSVKKLSYILVLLFLCAHCTFILYLSVFNLFIFYQSLAFFFSLLDLPIRIPIIINFFVKIYRIGFYDSESSYKHISSIKIPPTTHQSLFNTIHLFFLCIKLFSYLVNTYLLSPDHILFLNVDLDVC